MVVVVWILVCKLIKNGTLWLGGKFKIWRVEVGEESNEVKKTQVVPQILEKVEIQKTREEI